MKFILLFLLSLSPLLSQSVLMNVESFGAVADGHTDNTAAINRAITAMHVGQTLQFPCTSGNYYMVASPIDFGRMQYMSIQGSGPGCYLLYKGTSAQPYAFSFAGAEVLDIRNMDFYSNWGVTPQTVISLGRRAPNVQSGQFKFNSVRVEGYATKAVVYSIASEENTWMEPTIILNGGGALYAFYTSGSDDLDVNNLSTASNLSLWMQNFHVADFSPTIDPTHILIYDAGTASATGNHTYRDGYMASSNGTAFGFASVGQGAIAWMGLTVDSNRFENGYQMFRFTGGGSFGDIALTNNKVSGVSKYLINLPTTCYDCTFQGNNVGQGDSTTSVFGVLANSHVSEHYPFTVEQASNTYLFNRTLGSLQIGSTGSQPACSSSTEGTMWYVRGLGSLQLCQFTSGTYAWVSH